MKIKATLKKPYNYKERAFFVSKWGMYEIRETDKELQAWGRTQEEEEAFELENKKESVRRVRNNYLEETDKFVSIPDFPIDFETKDLYIEYRQYLRDYTKLKDWWEQEPKIFEDWRENEES